MGIVPAVWLFACLVTPFTVAAAAAANGDPTPVSFVASDKVTIFADYYGGRDAGRPLIFYSSIKPGRTARNTPRSPRC
jgi:hypothetical protein